MYCLYFKNANKPDQFLVQIRVSFFSNLWFCDAHIFSHYYYYYNYYFCFYFFLLLFSTCFVLLLLFDFIFIFIFVMPRYHRYYCFHLHLYQFFNLFCFSLPYYYYYGFVFFFLLLIKQFFFSHDTVKVSRLFCFLVFLLCFLSWNYRVIIHSFITFLPFPNGLRFSSFISILT